MNLKNIKYRDILINNSSMSRSLPSTKYKVKVLSNITTSQLNEILEYNLRIEKIPAKITSGNYDNIVQDTYNYHDSDLIIIFWELSNIVDGLQYKIELFKENELKEIYEKIKSEIELVIKNLRKTPLILFNKFSSIHFCSSNIRECKLEALANRLNNYLKNNKQTNVKLVNLEKVIANVGVEQSLDLRYYYSSKSLYTIEFFKAYAEFVKPIVMAVNGKTMKALIFDCDNTLWKGILGEDGFNAIEMSTETNNGAIFSEIQALALSLSNNGVLIGLCSKNNYDDVFEVINSHPDMLIRESNIAINKINWLDKVINLKQIAKELNIGLNSIVFVDDSSFEINMVREQLPEIVALQVPEKLSEYPKLIRESSNLFYNLSLTAEDKKKIQMYKQQAKREIVKRKFANSEDYLASLEVEVTITEDNNLIIPRLSQMCQKTNQFNLVTRRYTEGDIKKFIESKNSTVLSLSYVDKFGDSGITGLCIIKYFDKKQSAEIITLLMSCRIIGRNVEYAFMNYIIKMLKKRNVSILNAKYIKTRKNALVKNFYDKCSFKPLDLSETSRRFTLDLNNYQPNHVNYIRTINEK